MEGCAILLGFRGPRGARWTQPTTGVVALAVNQAMLGTIGILLFFAYLVGFGVLARYVAVWLIFAGVPGLIAGVIGFVVWWTAFVPLGVLSYARRHDANSMLGRIAKRLDVS